MRYFIHNKVPVICFIYRDGKEVFQLPIAMSEEKYCYWCSTGNNCFSNSTILQLVPYRCFLIFPLHPLSNTLRTYSAFLTFHPCAHFRSIKEWRMGLLFEYICHMNPTKICWVLETVWYVKCARSYFPCPHTKEKNNGLAM